MIHLITFDLDNTLWVVETVIVRAEREMQDWIKIQVPQYTQVASNKLISKKIREKISKGNAATQHDISLFRISYLTEMFLECGIKSSETTRLAENAFAVFMKWRNKVHFFEGALDTLKTLSVNYELAALTNGNADISQMGLDTYFSFAINAADVGASKPAPDMFMQALALSGASTNQAIHIGDNRIDDIEGANKVGFYTIWVNLKNSEKDSVATSTVHDLYSIESAVIEINNQS